MTRSISRNSIALMRSIEMVKGGSVFGYIQTIDPNLSTGEYLVAERLLVYADRVNINQLKNGLISFDVYVLMRNPEDPDNKDKIKIVEKYEGCAIRDCSSIKDDGQFAVGENVEISYESWNDNPVCEPAWIVTKEIGNEDVVGDCEEESEQD